VEWDQTGVTDVPTGVTKQDEAIAFLELVHPPASRAPADEQHGGSSRPTSSAIASRGSMPLSAESS
jgi:hypothetical protein